MHVRFAWTLLASALLTGCGFTATSTPTPLQIEGPALKGIAHGGRQPIAGQQIYVYAAGTGGYGTASTSLLGSNVAINNAPGTYGIDGNNNYYVLTDANGNFTIPAGDYTCTTNQQVYLYGVGGDTGGGTPNSAASLMAVLGACPVAGNFASAYVIMNETTTVAAAYATAGFSTDSTHIASSGTALALTGIANAFANAAQLVSVPTGTTLATTPNGNGTVPQATINTIANFLAACVNTTGPGSSGCTTLFNNILSGGATGTAATDTATAAIYLAHNPTPGHSELYTNYGSQQIINLCALQVPGSPFNPALPCTGNSSTSYINEFANSYPNDFTLMLQFSGVGSNAGTPVIDGSGNVWLLSYLIYQYSGPQFRENTQIQEFSPLGVQMSPSTGYPITGGRVSRGTGLAFDQNGNGWMPSGDFYYNGNDDSTNLLVKISSSGTATVCAGTGSGGLNYPGAFTIDGKGNIWIANIGQFGTANTVVEFDKNCNPITTSGTTYTGGGLNDPATVAADGSGNIWIGNLGFTVPNSLTVFGNSGIPVTTSSAYTGGGLEEPVGLGFDSAGKAWTTNQGGFGVSEFYNNGTAVSATTLTGGGDNSYFQYSSGGLLSIDGAGNIWTANYVDPTGLNSTIGSAVTEYGNDRTVISPYNGYTGTTGYGIIRGAVPDGSGNIWATASYPCSCNSRNPTLNEYIGLSVPVITPISAGLPSTFTVDGSSNLGTRP